MRVIRFAAYYIKLQVRVALGFHYTSHPLDIAWRWSFWRRMDEAKRRNLQRTTTWGPSQNYPQSGI
ncbi:MAG: hypothetical protein IT174_03360 [Acidobacteria bacterium]|nr:hypothetical protein [Acidobacteriota bacterium]